MPQIVNRRFDLMYYLAKQEIQCVVTCTVNFTKNEFEKQLQQALQYKIQCQLCGANSGLNELDELVHTYELQVLPSEVPAPSVDITFEEVLPVCKLKAGCQKDELYGLLTLTNSLLEPKQLEKKTNVVEFRF